MAATLSIVKSASAFRAPATASRPSPTERVVMSFVESAHAMLSEFAHRADVVVAEMEAGDLFSLAEFERHWDDVQVWLKARLKQVRATEAAAERAVAKSRWQTGVGGSDLSHEALVDLVLSLDRLSRRIERMLLNTSTETYTTLAALKTSCLRLRDGILD